MVTAIIAAAGSGKRMQRGMNKVFIPLFDYPVLLRTIDAFDKVPEIDKLIIVVGKDEVEYCNNLIKQYSISTKYIVIAGGSERQFSIYNALTNISDEEDIVVIHDGARPLIDRILIEQCIRAAREDGAAVVGVKVKDTIKVVSDDNIICRTPNRDKLWAVQTPQAFKREIIVKAYQQAVNDSYIGTDDASLVERTGHPVKIIEGRYDNIKLTTPEDIIIAEALMKGGKKRMIRVGMGYDVHKLVLGRDLIVGGVCIPYELGLEGHSDADVLLHAIKDALLGAAGLGDIGKHFPDTNEAFKGISSLVLLDKVGQMLKDKGYIINNIDATIMAQKPKFAPYIPEMNAKIAKTLGISISSVNVKATTTEGLGFVGRKEGIAACAVAMIECLE